MAEHTLGFFTETAASALDDQLSEKPPQSANVLAVVNSVTSEKAMAQSRCDRPRARPRATGLEQKTADRPHRRRGRDRGHEDLFHLAGNADAASP